MRINITYPDDKLQRTDEVAQLLGLSRSAFISMCVSYYIATMIDGSITQATIEQTLCRKEPNQKWT